jgi:hypothetical protein
MRNIAKSAPLVISKNSTEQVHSLGVTIEPGSGTQAQGPKPDVSAAFGGNGAAPTPDWPEEPQLPGPPTPKPLPIDAFPSALQKHVLSVAGAMQVPADLPALLALGCVSAALSGRVEVNVRAGWREPASLYAACVLPPASRKSPCYAAMCAPVREWEADQIQQAAPGLAKARDLVAVCERSLDGAIKATAVGKGTEDEVVAARLILTKAEADVPHDGRLLAGDVTPEEMVRRLAAQGGRLAILEPEPGPLQLLAGRYSDSARLDELKKAWSGDPIQVDRVNRSPLRVERPALTLAVLLQPGVIRDLPNGAAFRYEGVLGRFLWCAPPHGLGSRLTGAEVPALDAKVATEYRRVLRVLLDLKPPTLKDSTPCLHLLNLATEAVTHLHEFEAEVERELADGGKYEEVQDWAGKMVGQAVRVAALLALARRAGDKKDLLDCPIDAQSMEDAVRLLRALGTHALNVLAGAGDDGRLADLGYILRRLADLGEEATERTLREATRGRRSIQADAQVVARLLDELVERGCIRRVLQLNEGPGHPPSPLVELHPKLRLVSKAI